MKILNLLGMISVVLISGCASTITHGDLPDIDTYPMVSKKSSVTVRFYQKSSFKSRARGGGEDLDVSIRVPDNIESDLRNIFVGSNAFSDVQVSEFSSKGISIRQAQQSPFFVELIDKPILEKKTEYFLDIVDDKGESAGGFSGSWYSPFSALISIFSLGMIPAPRAYEIDLKGVLYSNDKKVIKDVVIHDSATIWRWTPFLFWGKNAFATPDEVAKDFVAKGIKNIQLKVLE